MRGCRLGIVMPELIEMQARAIVEAALNNKYKRGLNPKVEIMVMSLCAYHCSYCLFMLLCVDRCDPAYV